MRVIELHKAEEKRSFVCDAVVFGDLLLHVLFQECHVAQETASEGSQELKEQLDLGVVAPEEKCTIFISRLKKENIFHLHFPCYVHVMSGIMEHSFHVQVFRHIH